MVERTGVVPKMVIPLLVNAIKDEMDFNEGLVRLPRSVNWKWFGFQKDVVSRRTLKNMSDVHQEWATPALNALKYRKLIDGAAELRQVLSQQAYGPWILEIQYRHVGGCRRTDGDTAALLSRLFDPAKVPNVIAVLVALSNNVPPRIESRPILASISTLQHLRALHIQDGFSSLILNQFCATVANLRRLEVVSLVCASWPIFEAEPLPEHLSLSTPPASLKKFFFSFSFGSIPPREHLNWLLQARNGYALRELGLNVTFLLLPSVEEHVCHGIVLDALKNTLPVLTALVLGDSSDESTDYARLYGEVLKSCTSLQELHLCDNLELNAITLPPSARRLCWRHCEPCDRSSTNDQEDISLAEFLKSEFISGRAANLRSVHVFHLVEGDTKSFSRVRAICEENKLKLSKGCDRVFF